MLVNVQEGGVFQFENRIESGKGECRAAIPCKLLAARAMGGGQGRIAPTIALKTCMGR